MIWQERRSNVRHAVEIPIRFRILNESNLPASTGTPEGFTRQRTKNMSENGLLFLSVERFKVGTLLELTFQIKDKTITLQGHVVHSSRDAESELYRTGICFPNSDHVFKVKMAEQVYRIDQYRKSLSEKEGRLVSEEEAANRWIREHSSEFADFYSRK